MNLFVLSGHGSEYFAAFLNGVILQQKNAAVITAAVITTRSRPDRDFRNRTGPDRIGTPGPDRIGTPDPVDRTGPDRIPDQDIDFF